VSVNSDAVTLTGTVALQTGDRVTYHVTGGAAIGGLGTGKVYFVGRGGNTIKLARTLAAATAAPPGTIDPTPHRAAATHTFTHLTTVNFAAAQSLQTGDRLVYTHTGAALGGLAEGKSYYVIRLSATQFRLARSLADATAAVPRAIDLTAAAGTHRLVDHT